jgi:hypothetical protein
VGNVGWFLSRSDRGDAQGCAALGEHGRGKKQNRNEQCGPGLQGEDFDSSLSSSAVAKSFNVSFSSNTRNRSC